MAHIVRDLGKYFKFDDVVIDNWVCSLFHKGCVVLFLAGSMVGILSQYFGDPISCDFKGIDNEMATDYCWIHGSSYIPKEYQPHMKCIVDLDGIESSDDAPDTSYYQWVTFMLLFQAGSFSLPHKIWKSLEGGLMKSFGPEGKSPILLKEDAKFDDCVVMDAVVEKYVRYFKSTLHHNNRYFFKFAFCELANYIILFLNFLATDKFLRGKFRYYGIRVVHYYQLSGPEQKVQVNPLCQVFPTEVSCVVPNIGSAGGEQHNNGLCILSQNIINEKVYLAIWFWLVTLMFVSAITFLYRVCTIFFDWVRYLLLSRFISQTRDTEARKAVKFVLSKCSVGDWFVLELIGKNVSMYFFRAFIKELRNELRDKPKVSGSTSTLKSNKALKMTPKPIPTAPPIKAEQSTQDSNNKLPTETDSLMSQTENV